MPLKSERKIIEVGGSRSVTIPPSWLDAYGLRLGDTVEVFADSLLFVKPKNLVLDLDLIRRELQILAVLEKR